MSDLLQAYVEQLIRDGKDSADEVRRAFDTNILQACPHIAAKKARDVTPDDICDILVSIIDRGARAQADKVRSYLNTAFNEGASADYDPARRGRKRFNLEHNPVTLTRKDKDAQQTHDRVLADSELRELYLNIQKANKVGIINACLVRMMIATAGQRPKMLIRTTWKDYDFERRTITLVERKGKGKPRAHVIPFTARAMRIMRIVQAHNGDLPGPFYTAAGKEMRLDSLKNIFKYWHGYRLKKCHRIEYDGTRTIYGKGYPQNNNQSHHRRRSSP